MDLTGKEEDVSICAKDSGCPHDYELTTKLIHVHKGLNLNCAVDVSPFYGSGIGAASRALLDFKGAYRHRRLCVPWHIENSHLRH